MSTFNGIKIRIVEKGKFFKIFFGIILILGAAGNNVAHANNPTVSSVTVKTAPTDVSYTEGDALALAGLEITITYSDATTEDVLFADFATKSVTTSIQDGATLALSDTSITITVGGQTATQAITVAAAVTPAPAPAPTLVPTVDWVAIERALAAEKAAAEKLAADKLTAEKAAAEAKVAAEKLAAEKALAEAKAAAEAKALAEAQAAAEQKAAEEAAAVVAAAEKKAAASTVKLISSSKSTNIKLDLADRYYGRIAYVQLVTKTKTGVKTTTLDYFVIENEDGTADIKLKKLAKGQKLQVRIGKTIVFSRTL
jgi:hypothetical protein